VSALSVGKRFASNAIAINKCICFVDDITMYVIDYDEIMRNRNLCPSSDLNCPFYCPKMTEIKDAALLDFIRFCT